MLKEKIQGEVKESMKARDSVKTDVLRGILAAFTNELVATKRTPQDELSDEEAVLVVQRLAKQRKDSIEQYRAGGRDDLVEQEKVELAIIKKYLPQMMARGEIKKLAIAKQTEMSLTDPSKKGMLMGALMKDLRGKAEGGDVKDVVDEMFG
ncbi:MAG: GatB/YqeY domain-containing protein [Candidatus Pacebacteria bacterium]|nr:GatB/YqeY domain-containing protein [Candidatus Paceibacterota bacterium]